MGRGKNIPDRGGAKVCLAGIFHARGQTQKKWGKKSQNETNAERKRHDLTHPGMWNMEEGEHKGDHQRSPGQWLTFQNKLSLPYGEGVAGQQAWKQRRPRYNCPRSHMMVAWLKVVEAQKGGRMWGVSWLGHMTGLTWEEAPNRKEVELLDFQLRSLAGEWDHSLKKGRLKWGQVRGSRVTLWSPDCENAGRATYGGVWQASHISTQWWLDITSPCSYSCLPLAFMKVT